MTTLDPCKQAKVLKTVSDKMVYNGQKIESHFAMFIFLYVVVGNAIPNVKFGDIGELHFK